MPRIRYAAVLLAFTVLLIGCLPGAKAPYLVELYTFDYVSPALTGTPSDEIVKVDKFAAAQSYNSAAMVYQPEAYKIAVYNHHKWRVNPGDMVADYLRRDFRASGLFRAVLSYRQPETARFVVEGGVEEFLEAKEKDGWKAILGLQVTLLDLTRPEITRRVVFQKRYRVAEPISEESPKAFAAGMSAAMAKVSVHIVSDVYCAVKEAGR
jgi:ABC-type uncharacterized transport system auxiliary subunit